MTSHLLCVRSVQWGDQRRRALVVHTPMAPGTAYSLPRGDKPVLVTMTPSLKFLIFSHLPLTALDHALKNNLDVISSCLGDQEAWTI